MDIISENIWLKLLNGGFVSNNFDIKSKIFAIKIVQNEFKYISDTYHQFYNQSLRNKLFEISVTFSNDTQIIELLFDKFEIFCDYSNIHYNKIFKNKLLMSACNKNHNVNILKYLIEGCKIHIRYLNMFEKNCLSVACKHNNLDIIKYLINECKMDVIFNDNDYEENINCLFNACQYNNDIEIIKYLINECRMDVNDLDEHNNNCLLKACIKNNLNVIKYLINECKMDINHCNDFGENCLLISCNNKINLDVIKFLVDECKVNTTQLDSRMENCFHKACRCTANLDIIKYLDNKCRIDINQKARSDNNCLMFACRTSSEHDNLDIIKFLIEGKKMNVNETNFNNENCLTWAMGSPMYCFNINISVIKFVINECIIDTSHKNNNGFNCLTIAIKNNLSEIYKYMIECTEIEFQVEHFELTRFIKIIKEPLINFRRLNELLIRGITFFGVDKLKGTILTINPLILRNDIFELTHIINPWNLHYDVFISHVLAINHGIIVPVLLECDNKLYSTKLINTKKDILFIHNNIRYYGDRDICYPCISLLEDIHEFYDLFETIEITIPIPVEEYIILIYIDSCYSGFINMNLIIPVDFVGFLYLIDKYPTKNLSVNLLEKHLIKYIHENQIIIDQWMKLLFKKYHSKYMYLYLYCQNKKQLNENQIYV